MKLRNVAVVKGFHVNVISEQLLHKTGIWYSGYDCTLRYGAPSTSVVIANLKREHNITFLEYKPTFVYEHDPSEIAAPVNQSEHSSRPFRPSVDPPKPREDDETLWHLRAGHLGREALEALVKNTRGVIIKGTERRDCDACATTHATRVISKRQSEQRAASPFMRVFWDLQDYPTSYNNMEWVMTLKDDYSSMIYVLCLPNKHGTTVFNALFFFERFVRRQFGVMIRAFRMDNERAIIAVKGLTAFEKWTITEGIATERTPSYASEPNGGAERAGKEVTEKSIKMLNGANLPTNLWPESVTTAAMLLNITPKRSLGWKAPRDKLESWFKEANMPLKDMSVDTRPNWNGIYAYGCKAFPLIVDRAAGREKRLFKTSPRGHIGYLVSYVTTNVFRIWVPRLEKVIVTRDVTFNERCFYQLREESSTELPEATFNSVTVEEDEDDDLHLFQHSLLRNLAHDHATERSRSGVEAQEAQETSESQDKEGSQTLGGLQTPENTPERDPDPPEHTIADIQARGSSDRTPENPDIKHLKSSPAEQLPNTPRSPGNVSERPERDQRARPGVPEPQEMSTAENPPDQGEQAQPTGGVRKSTRKRKPRLPFEQVHAVISNSVGDTRKELPEPLQALDYENTRCLTILAVFAAAATEKNAARLRTKTQGKIHRDQLVNVPTNWKEASAHPLSAEWLEAALLEIEAMRAKGVWREIPCAETRSKPLPLKWVFSYKFDASGMLERCKARICVRGDLQEEITIQQTYAATLAARSFRILIALAAHFGLEIKQFDIKTAFLNAKRDEHGIPVTCELPPGFKRPNICVELDKALYGLKDSPMLWFKEFSSRLASLGLLQSAEEPCMFYSPARDVYVVFFVDDVLVFYHHSRPAAAEAVIKGIKEAYEVHDQGDAEWFLGIEIIRDRKEHTICLSHAQYIEKMTTKYDLVSSMSNPMIPVPIIEYRKPEEPASAKEVKRYQELVGSLLYSAVMIRVDIAFAASLLSRFLQNPAPEHHKAACQAIRYLYATRSLALCYKRSTAGGVLAISSDASFGDDLDTRKSSQGMIITLFGGPVVWKATRQPTVSTSTTEAELLGLEQTAKEALGMTRLFRDMKFDPEEELDLKCDNAQTIRLVCSENMRITTRLRHVDIQNMWLRQEFRKGTFKVTYLNTKEMPADGLTKALPRQRFEDWRAMLQLHDTSF